MRGIGMVPLTDQMDSSVGYTVDGVPYSYGPMNSFDQFDVEQVEVDRGPQGTAGGKNYNMGTINVTNKQASFANEASGSVTYGRYNTIIGDGAVSLMAIPLTCITRDRPGITKTVKQPVYRCYLPLPKT
jgi:outer membrane receptor protein involved in Fe transport